MRNLLFTIIFITLTFLCSAQPGSLDTSFNPEDIGFDYKGSYLNNSVRSIAVQADGKIMVVGDFTANDEFSANGIVRLSSVGVLDLSFNTGVKTNGPVNAIAIQNDSKILLGGAFTNYNGDWDFDYLARLYIRGGLDTEFNPDRGKYGGDDTGPGGNVTSIAVQTDGKILIGGEFVSYNLVPRNHLARLNSDGTLDETFRPDIELLQTVSSIALQRDGRILIIGSYYDNNSNIHYYINRLHSDGSLDTTFSSGSGVNNSINSIVVQADGKILIGGNFTAYNGTTRNRIARLNIDGSLDATFNPGIGADSVIRSIVLNGDGKILIGGDFTSFMGATRRGLVRLNSDGNMDISFNSGSGTDRSVYSIALGRDDKILIGGNFTAYNGVTQNYIACLNSDGSLDMNFGKSRGANGTVSSLALQQDSKVIVGGNFTTYNGTLRNHITRIYEDGALDASFDPGSGADSAVQTTAVQADGKILIGGNFTAYNGTTRNRIARLNIDGSLDATFNPGIGADSVVLAFAIQTDGKILIGGHFTSYDNTARSGLARLNSDGSLDIAFNSGRGVLGRVSSIALQNDGKILIGGDFTSYNGTPRKSIARLNPDGSLDASFDPSGGPNSSVTSVVLQNDGRILIGGYFTEYNGKASSHIARLNVDGSLDTAFNLGTKTYDVIHSIALQSNGKIIVGGNEFARLYSDGSHDASFVGSVDLTIYSLAALSEENVLIGGDFTSCYSNAFQTFKGRNRIARIFAGTNTITLGTISPLTYCAGSEIVIPYTLTGVFPIETFFQVWLSDSTGSFDEEADVNVLGQVTGAGSGTVHGRIPDYIGTGTGYKVRMVSITDDVFSPDSGVSLTIQAATRLDIVVIGDTSFCQGGSVLLTSSAAIGNQWYKDGETISGATAQSYTATVSGIYTVMAINGGCPSLMSPEVTVKVNVLPATPNITPSGDTSFCQGGSVLLTSSAAIGNQWYKDGETISGATAQTYTATQAGQYKVRVSQDGCVAIAASLLTVTVKPIPAKPVISQNGNTLSSSSISGNQWYLNGTIIPGANAQQLVVQASGVYTVQVSEDGCSVQSDGHNFVMTGIVDPSLWNIEVTTFPNPVQDNLFISNTKGRKLKVSLLDMIGRKLAEVHFSASSSSISMEKLTQGTYLLLITDVNKGETVSRTVVK